MISKHLIAFSFSGMLLIVAGCGLSSSPDFSIPSVSSSGASKAAMATFDTNTDGLLDATELENCQALAGALALYDSDGDGKISSPELTERFKILFANGANYVNLTCRIRKGRTAVAGAKVNFAPVAIFGDSLASALGTTDSSGTVFPAISDENLPEELKGQRVIQVGLYEVLVDYKGQTFKFGHEVDPISRIGLEPTFDLSKASR